MKNTRIKLIFFFIFALIIVRLPFLSFPLVGEEGTISLLLLDMKNANLASEDGSTNSTYQSQSECQLLVAHADGKLLFVPPERNMLPYFLICKVIGPVHQFFYSHTASFTGKTVLSRLAFFLTSLIGFIFIFKFSLQKLNFNNKLSLSAVILSVIGICNSPLYIGGSIQPQLDGVIGLTIFSILAWVTGNDNHSNSKFYAFIAGIIFSFGKNEWAYAVVLSLIIISLFRIFLRNNFKNSSSIINNISYIYAGLFLGILIPYIYSQDDYLLWFDLARRINDLTSESAKLTLFYNLKYIHPLLAIAALSIIIFICNIVSGNYEEKSFFWILVGLIIFIAYLKTGWRGDGFPRYYIPSGVAFLAAFVFGYSRLLKKQKLMISHITLYIFLVINALSMVKLFYSYIDYQSITSKPGHNLNKFENNIRYIKNNENKNEIYLFDSSIMYYYPEISFISSDLGEKSAENLIKNYYKNKKLIIID